MLLAVGMRPCIAGLDGGEVAPGLHNEHLTNVKEIKNTLEPAWRSLGSSGPDQQFAYGHGRDVQPSVMKHHAGGPRMILQVGRCDVGVEEEAHSSISGRSTLRCWRFHSRYCSSPSSSSPAQAPAAQKSLASFLIASGPYLRDHNHGLAIGQSRILIQHHRSALDETSDFLFRGRHVGTSLSISGRRPV